MGVTYGTDLDAFEVCVAGLAAVGSLVFDVPGRDASDAPGRDSDGPATP